MLAIYSRCVNAGEALEKVLTERFPWCHDHGAEIKRIFQEYVERKSQRELLDYDDLLLYWEQALTEPAVGSALARRFQHILVDEYQDTNPIQASILEKTWSLMGESSDPNTDGNAANRSIMVVGDDAQSIYSFRGATVENILRFPEQFPGTTTVTLDQNYRSVTPILDPTLNAGNTVDRATAGSITYGDPNSKPPRYQNWNFSIQQALSNTMTLTVAYTGNNGKFEDGGGRGIWSNQMDPKYLALGSLLTAQATPGNIAAAATIVPGVGLPFANFKGTISQMLRPFPQYAGITDVFGNIGQSNYNALQVTFAKRMAGGLTFNANYTLSKNFSDFNGGRSAYHWQDAKSLTTTDQPHVFNALVVYELPFSQGRALAPSNRVARGVLSGWRLSGITRVYSGFPLGTMMASCNLPNAGGCLASFNPGFSDNVRSVRINGEWGSGDLLGSNAPAFLDKNAFINPAAYTYGNTPITGAFGLRAPHAFNQDLSLKRDFRIKERVRVLFQWDAFNAFNNVRFSAPSVNTTSAAFGKITSQANSPRLMQVSTRIEF